MPSPPCWLFARGAFLSLSTQHFCCLLSYFSTMPPDRCPPFTARSLYPSRSPSKITAKYQPTKPYTTLPHSRSTSHLQIASVTRQRPTSRMSRIGGCQTIVCAMTESRGVSATIGLCFVNLSTGVISCSRESIGYWLIERWVCVEWDMWFTAICQNTP